MTTPGPVKVASKRPGSSHLDPLWRALGLAERRLDGAVVRVRGARVRIDGGFYEDERVDLRGDLRVNRQLRDVQLSVAFEGPPVPHARKSVGPSMTLRAESRADVRDKERGLTREVQTGDEEFDRAIFIDSDAVDDEVLEVLKREDVRTAVMLLVHEGHGPVRVTSRTVACTVDCASGLQPERVLGALTHLLTVSRGGGLRTTSAQARGGESLEALSGATLVLMALWALLVHQRGWGSLWVYVVGALVGLVAATVLRPRIEGLVSGDSRSGQRAFNILGALGLALGLATVATLFTVNKAFAPGRYTDERGRVSRVFFEERRVRKGTGSSTRVERVQRVTILWSAHDLETRDFSGPVHVGQTFIERTWEGALGVSWVEPLAE